MRRPRGCAVEKRPGVWQLRASSRPDAAGQVRKRTKTYYSRSPKPRSGGLPRDVERELAKWVQETDDMHVVGPAHSYKELVGEWFKVADLEETTRHGYEAKLRLYIYPEFGHRKVSDITVQMLDHFYAQMRRDGYAARTIRQTHAILRRSLAMAAKWGWIAFNPAAMTSPELKGVETDEVDAPSPDEVRSLLAEIEKTDPLLDLFIRVSAALGTRRGETLALQWHDVDHLERTITVERSVYRISGGPIKEKGTKTGAEGTLAVPAALVAALEDQYRGQRGDAYIFTDDPAGQVPWLPDSVTHRVARIRDQLGLPARLTVKNLRHFHATQLLANGVDLGTVAARLRHADKATTMRFYSKKDAAADRRAADVWGDVL